MLKPSYFPGKTGVWGARKSVEDFLRPDFDLPRCLESTLKGSILGFLGLKSPLLASISGDFDNFLEKSIDIVPDDTIDVTLLLTSDPYY